MCEKVLLMTELRSDLNNWAQVYDYLLRQYRNRESKYANSNSVAKPDVIIPRENVTNAGETGYFERTSRSFDLGAEYNMRQKTYRCSIQVRKYNSGEHLHNSLHHNNNVFLGTDIPTDILSVDKDLYFVQINWKNPEATSHKDVKRSVRALIGHLFTDVIGYNPGQFFKQSCTEEMSCGIR